MISIYTALISSNPLLALNKYSKEELRELRAQFQKLISNELVEVKRSLGKIDQYGLKELEMISHDSSFQQQKEELLKDYVQSYEDTIDSMY